MDDFYIYYTIDDENPRTGQIYAVAPSEITGVGEMLFIRVPAVYGMQFTAGRKSIGNWVVQYDNDTECMILSEHKTQTGIIRVPVFFQIPRAQKNPEMIITFRKKEKCFHVQIPTRGLKQPKQKMRFFVTPADDPNVLFFHFPVDFSDAAEPDGCVISCSVDLPKKFSIFTNKVMERYQMRVAR